MKLIVGLGNPGEEYQNSRHNTGFMIIDFILSKKIEWKQSSGTKALFYKDYIAGKPAEYIKPTTFMNNSGVAVAFLKDKHKLNLKDIVIIYDDIDLPIGKMKISYDKSSGGHNGLESIIKKLKSKEFVRIRIGISPETPSGKLRKPKGEKDVLKFLLGEYKEKELVELKKLSKKVAQALETIVTEGKDKAMSLYN
ncbi:MAG: Peptidyl-tRNA hydrolase [Candidatus Nomurabacteria bacterium GW2011_GWE1_32_28]|uniref:Peptidyl-tRNA hydrolase n=1 Tax=Candidatus Nomurabacteria bacterium GW2011_GWF1_31_48 TaxID=1618767 RepID=A0A0G0BGG6_9BACT|nr:MAG: Peptidyl-tRNA hydrolase [Candidatus Nomurabacteria bacterium GW2011_GWF2_30_133]KKP28527.1 MAG: Peptidyl-tRNA hydrolase [Candidatus Nomurabacteria bacterium GW2011_GWE2_31_40]KKP30122.1 MAG: Peptidyl-tRNA hydrolase [Candidatus Nomurabacteria bacterium GW2011_GWF1_31_48]KKP34667.1 MAG: Peptidyl-tRNA hydrolase [Candidatus Nomurabacteria bacterium GW2011_GWE1_32_28]HAS80872.1 aminoacyl-tRNA hydrolase [Candidatus Nomurabacteria bacterium]